MLRIFWSARPILHENLENETHLQTGNALRELTPLPRQRLTDKQNMPAKNTTSIRLSPKFNHFFLIPVWTFPENSIKIRP